MDPTIIAAIIGAIALIIAAIIPYVVKEIRKRKRSHPTIDRARVRQCLNLGAMVSAGGVIEQGHAPDAPDALRKAIGMAVSLAVPDKNWMTLFKEAQNFQGLMRTIEDYFRSGERLSERVHYELGTVLGNLKIVGQKNQDIMKMVLHFLFVTCGDDFSPMPTVPVGLDLKRLIKCLHSVHKTGTITVRDMKRISEKANKIWDSYIQGR